MTKSLVGFTEDILAREAATPLACGLYIVATPIGNLADITIRALSILDRANYVCCEDTRRSLKLMQAYGLSTHLSAYHDHNAERQRPKILSDLAKGFSIALISDAGTPLISDPGYKLVRDAVSAGFSVVSVPGPSAVTTALSVSALPTDAFFFAGFLPPKRAAARQRLTECAAIPGTLIFFETANRLDATLESLSEVYPGRKLVIARELTKRFEEILRTSLPFVRLEETDWKGEFVLLVAPPVHQEATEDELMHALTAALEHASLRDAVDEVTRTFGVPRKKVYNLALQSQRGETDADGP